ncbi:MAG: hypothetical protein CMJ78_15830, partial [Planctomycetaceae bacterium]|nr:hypothetical protein [Planctomycetaceae bacterium]
CLSFLIREPNNIRLDHDNLLSLSQSSANQTRILKPDAALGESTIDFHTRRIENTTIVCNTRDTTEAYFEIDEFASNIEFAGGRIRNYKIGFDFHTDDENNGQLETWKIGGFACSGLSRQPDRRHSISA